MEGRVALLRGPLLILLNRVRIPLNLRDGLLPKLMRGEIRIKDVEK